MERAISSDERIRRAEEIYQRRREANYRINEARVNVNNSGKDYRLLKRTIFQIITCLLIYFIFYTARNSDYIFSKEFLKQVKEILSYDISIEEISQNMQNWLENEAPANEEENNSKEITETEKQQYDEKTEGNSTETKEEKIEPQEQTLSVTEESSSISESMTDAEYIKYNFSIINPLSGTITSRFGVREPTTPTVPKYHTGIDIAANTGTKFVAAMSGKVVQVSSEGDYGNHIKIQKDDIYTLYAHCSNIYVKEGEEVNQGQEIGEVGETGNATGPHLHFEIRREDRYVDPDDVLDF